MSSEGQKTGSISRNDYEMERNAAKWQVEREATKDVQREMREGDKEAEAMNEQVQAQDPNYSPSNPQEESMEKEYREGGGKEI
ncbi:hypothetical protein Ndes2526B_g01518 [Nannochloris sp. 'desiccata']|nr:hypothetical protein KSW81_004163 [Chlorella desiccata (nom. nud.)]KAH7624255.1 hypothetical protein NADE_009067 [Chlorella desiccata (nom. nud.)]